MHSTTDNDAPHGRRTSHDQDFHNRPWMPQGHCAGGRAKLQLAARHERQETAA
ncbi:hypothetical protein [Streptomyces hydrogenans]